MLNIKRYILYYNFFNLLNIYYALRYYVILTAYRFYIINI